MSINIKQDDEVATQIASSVTREDLNVNPPPSLRPFAGPTAAREKIPRAIVDSDHVTALVRAHSKYLAEYSKTKKSVTQLVPALVWREVYLDFKSSFPNSHFVEDTLKERLRKALKESETGTLNVEKTEKGLPQDDDVLAPLKATNDHATYDVSKNSALLEKTPVEGTTHAQAAPSQFASSSKGNLVVATRTKPSPKGPDSLHTKRKTLGTDRQAAAIEAMSSLAGAITSNRELKDALLVAKADKFKLSSLKDLLDRGVITQEEYNKKARQFFERI